MGLLDGGLQAIIGGAFAGFFPNATLHTGRSQEFVDGRPQGPVAWVDTPCKGMVESYGEAYRLRTGIPETDVKIIVLQAGVGLALDTDCEITAQGQQFATMRYKIMSIGQDAAQASWELRGRPVAQFD